MAGAVAALQRTLPSSSIRLPPLSVDDVAHLFNAHRADGDTEGFARTVHARTGGLALYASELARVVRNEHAIVDPRSVPVAIRDWVTHRVSGLEVGVRTILELAALIGERFDPAILVRSSSFDDATIARHCDELVIAGLLTSTDTDAAVARDHPGLGFAHAITHNIVYEHLGVTRRNQLHAAVASALISDAAEHNFRPNHAEVAHHLTRAGTGKRSAAAAHARLAGHDDFRTGAWAAAASQYATAADLAPDDEQRAESLIDRGRAELRAEQFDDATASLSAALDLARLHGLAFVQAEARVGVLTVVVRRRRGTPHAPCQLRSANARAVTQRPSGARQRVAGRSL